MKAKLLLEFSELSIVVLPYPCQLLDHHLLQRLRTGLQFQMVQRGMHLRVALFHLPQQTVHKRLQPHLEALLELGKHRPLLVLEVLHNQVTGTLGYSRLAVTADAHTVYTRVREVGAGVLDRSASPAVVGVT
jgi:hypothetical protein